MSTYAYQLHVCWESNPLFALDKVGRRKFCLDFDGMEENGDREVLRWSVYLPLIIWYGNILWWVRFCLYAQHPPDQDNCLGRWEMRPQIGPNLKLSEMEIESGVGEWELSPTELVLMLGQEKSRPGSEALVQSTLNMACTFSTPPQKR